MPVSRLTGVQLFFSSIPVVLFDNPRISKCLIGFICDDLHTDGTNISFNTVKPECEGWGPAKLA